MLSNELYKKTIDELESTLLYLLFYFQGEPYLHPEFLDLVKYSTKKGIYTATSTNAHYLNNENARKTVESGLDRLIISIDGTTQETYESYRIGGNLDKVIAGAKEIVKWKKQLKSNTPHVIFQFLVVKPNEHQLDDVRNLAKSVGVDDVLFKTAQIYDFENGSPLIPVQEKYSRYTAKEDGTYSIKNKLLDHCWKMWHSCVVTWDGQVVPCCFDKDAHHVMGNLSNSSFSSMWSGPEYQSFRQKLIRSRSNIEMCQNCTEGSQVWA
jgi:radical SAM protein with 4Fe4S-binding SPASM domain